ARPSRLLVAAVLLAGCGCVAAVAIAARLERAARTAPAQGPAERRGAMDAAAWFPLQLGSRWTYREGCHGSERTVTGTAAAAANVDGVRVVQLAETRSGAVRFSFWSTDPQGVHRHETNSMVEDPCLQPAVTAATQGLLLPSPIGAETRWTWRR